MYMTKPCKLGGYTSRNGRRYTGIGPPNCTIQSGEGNQPLKSRAAATTGGTPDKVTVAKQRPIDNGSGAPHGNAVFRTTRITFVNEDGHTKTKDFNYCTLDTGNSAGDFLVSDTSVSEICNFDSCLLYTSDAADDS